MIVEKVPFTLRAVVVGLEEGDGEEHVVVTLKWQAYPFAKKVADQLSPGNVTKFFNGDHKPASGVRNMEMDLDSPELVTVVLYKAEDSQRHLLKLVDVSMGAAIRLTKVTHSALGVVYKAGIECTFPYPEPKDLLTLAASLKKQMFLSIEEQQGSLLSDTRG